MVLDRVLQVRRKYDGRFVMGKGKLQDVLIRAMQLGAEVLAFDAAVAATLARAETLTEHAVTVVVTADHECGGLVVGEGLDEDGLPDSRWLWLDHTNRDVPVFAWGDGGELIDGQRVDNSFVHAVLDGALRSRSPVAPYVPRVPDGDLDDLGSAVATQVHEAPGGLLEPPSLANCPSSR